MLSSIHKLPTHNEAAHARFRLHHRRPWSGVTLVEMLLVVTIVAMLMAVLAPCLRSVHQGWQANDRRSEVLQNARVGMAQMTRILRQLCRVSSVSESADASGHIEFYDTDSVLMRFERNSSSGYLDYGSPGNLSTLAGPASALTFQCYDAVGNLLAPVDVAQARTVRADLTVADMESQANPIAVASKVLLRTDPVGVVINEIMYSPRGSDKTYEWVELYNRGGPVDVAGWKLASIGSQTEPDIIGCADSGGASAILPKDGYAVITDKDTKIYTNTELLDNGTFERKLDAPWVDSGGWSRIRDGDVYEDRWKLARENSGWIYQEITISSAASSASFSCWEKTPSPNPDFTRLVITVRNTSDVVLSTLYDGPMHSSWTQHTANLSPHVGQQRRICLETIGAGTYWFDEVSVSCAISSYVDKDALLLTVDDETVGGQLDNTTGNITLFVGGLLIDMVDYQVAWGGDGNTRTLERISPTGDSMDPANWAESPIDGGTPGKVNGVSAP